jgi:hypothetical protein
MTRAQLKCFISDKARTAMVLNGLKNDPSDEYIGEVIFKINVVYKLRKSKLKFILNEHDFLSRTKTTDTAVISFVFSS